MTPNEQAIWSNILPECNDCWAHGAWLPIHIGIQKIVKETPVRSGELINYVMPGHRYCEYCERILDLHEEERRDD